MQERNSSVCKPTHLIAPRCVQILLDAAPNVINWSDYEGRTALHLAVADSASGDAAVVKTLLRDRRVQVE